MPREKFIPKFERKQKYIWHLKIIEIEELGYWFMATNLRLTRSALSLFNFIS